ncbi:MAG: hypothetical protein KDJ88_04765 [Bauldia sp.]|nr:hypothetical protein [Bauldia sp.]
MLRRSLVTSLALLAMAAAPVRSLACSFEDPNGAAAQRVILSVVYPNALYVEGAVYTALTEGILRPAHFAQPGDFFALDRIARNLRRFAGLLGSEAPPDMPEFSMVLMGPVLWTRFSPGADGIAAEPHVAGPLSGKVVVVSDAPVVAALVKGDLSGRSANEAGLLRYYGDAAEIEKISAALVAAFPGGGYELGSAGQDVPVASQ